MKTTIFRGPVSAATLLGLLSGCGDQTGQTNATTGAAPPLSAPAAQTGQVCYQQVVGRDTTTVRLAISGATVTGELAVRPAEKDRARGTFRGTLASNQIVADWQRAGEGVTQVHEITLTMAGDSLLWREGARTEKQGKWVLVNPSQGYQYVLRKVACAPQL